MSPDHPHVCKATRVAFRSKLDQSWMRWLWFTPSSVGQTSCLVLRGADLEPKRPGPCFIVNGRMLNDICKVCKCNICLLISAFCLFYRSVCVSSVTHDTYTFSTHADGRIPGKHFHLWPFDLVCLSIQFTQSFYHCSWHPPLPFLLWLLQTFLCIYFFTFHSVNLLIQYLYIGSLN